MRDVAALTQMRFPVWSNSIACKGAVEARVGPVNVPLVCAGELATPGDAIVADGDGVVVVPAARVPSVAEAAAEREAKEGDTRARLGSGALGLDLYGMRGPLAATGPRYLG